MAIRPSTTAVLKQIKGMERHLNRLKMVPATRMYRTIVLLPLLSKALTVSRAVCILVDADFPAEAYAMSRTLLEILFTVHYITNKDTEKRAQRYLKYVAKFTVEWSRVVQKHFPLKAAQLRAVKPSVLKTAKEFDATSNWTGERGQTRMMAIEEDTSERDEHGKGFKNEFDYDAQYFSTSQFVHATAPAVASHFCKTGEVFKVRCRRREEKDYGVDALFITVCSLCKLFVYACRSMNEQQPREANELYKMLRQFYGGNKSSVPA